jgi:hypothetical protein
LDPLLSADRRPSFSGSSPAQKSAAGRATRSNHVNGAAFDIAMANHDPVAFQGSGAGG